MEGPYICWIAMYKYQVYVVKYYLQIQLQKTHFNVRCSAALWLHLIYTSMHLNNLLVEDVPNYLYITSMFLFYSSSLYAFLDHFGGFSLSLCVCIYMYMHICAYIRTHTYVYLCIYTYPLFLTCLPFKKWMTFPHFPASNGCSFSRPMNVML